MGCASSVCFHYPGRAAAEPSAAATPARPANPNNRLASGQAAQDGSVAGDQAAATACTSLADAKGIDEMRELLVGLQQRVQAWPLIVQYPLAVAT